ncbi:MAG: DUF559 domain-containing protein [Solirubrobacterales bacterium]
MKSPSKADLQESGDVSPRSVEVTDLALGVSRRQHGLLTRRQLLSAGVSTTAITKRIKARKLLPVCTGVFALGRPVSSELGFQMAGVLASGHGSVLARRSAAALWDFLDWHGTVETTRPHSRRSSVRNLSPPGTSSRRALRTVRTRYLPVEHVRRKSGILVTSPARTLLDLAAVLPPDGLRSAFNRADRKKLLSKDELLHCIGCGPGRKGFATFRDLVAIRHPEIAMSRSDLEILFNEECQSRGFGKPLINSIVCGEEVDFFWPEANLIIEVDGYEFHQGRMTRDKDIRKENRLKRAGYGFHRFSHWMVTREIEEVMDLVRFSFERHQALRLGAGRTP